METEGFTLLEFLIVIVIVGILATLGITQYKAVKENAMDKEAQDNLKLIYAQELIFKIENTLYTGACGNSSVINSNLMLKLPTTSAWNYNVLSCETGGRFTAQATRTSSGPARNWCLNSVLPGNPEPIPVQQSADCACP